MFEFKEKFKSLFRSNKKHRLMHPQILWVSLCSILIVGCIGPIDRPAGLSLTYACSVGPNPIDDPMSLIVKVRLNDDEDGIGFTLADSTVRDYEIETAKVSYKMASGPWGIHENVDFSYVQGAMVFQTKKYESYPACQIEIAIASNDAKQVCEFEDETLGNRAKNFEMRCHMLPKMKHIE